MMIDNKRKEKKHDEGGLLNNLEMFSLLVKKTSQRLLGIFLMQALC